MSMPSKERNGQRWIRVDLHIHTPASEDYAEPDVTYLDILREAEQRGLELIAFTDHNTVHGYEQFQREIEFLQTLEAAGRLTDAEAARLAEYRRLLTKITVLPGFEFTSHYGAHILAIFAPQQPLSLMEATLLQLGVPPEMLKKGACSVPDTRYVAEAYEIIARAGGLAIAAHANGPNGVITETLRMGTSGQSRIAATQSQHLSALEFINFYTDHDKFTSPGFYNGKTEHYERRMFCIQGSDAHRLRRLPDSELHISHRQGIGDRYVEMLLPEASFEALRNLFTSDEFERVRVPKRDQKLWEVDALRFGAVSERQILRSVGTGALMETAIRELWKDVAALANAGGGVLIVGSEPGGQVSGVERPDLVSELLRQSVQEQLEQQPYISLELLNYEGRDIVRVEVRAEGLPPYVSNDGVIYVRRANATAPATRAEVMQLCRRALAEDGQIEDTSHPLELPHSGVEVVDAQLRGDMWYYEVRDLRTTAGVTRDKAQGLWAYAIARHEDLREKRVDLHSQVRWRGQFGVWRAYRQGNRVKYDLVHRDSNGVVQRVFYGVSDWGLGEEWASLLSERPAEEFEPELQYVEHSDSVGNGGNGAHGSNGGGAGGNGHSTGGNGQSNGSTMSHTDNGNTPIFIPGNPLEDFDQLPELATPWGERQYRWRGRGGLWRIYTDEQGQVRFDLAMRDKDGNNYQEYHHVPQNKLTDAWLGMIRVPRPRTGIEVVSAAPDDTAEWRYVFRDLRTGDSSGAPWRMQDIKSGTVREYAARMYLQDLPLDEMSVRWWGNIGYLRPMRSQVDLVYRDEHGIDHLFYAARRDELQGEWRELLEIYGEM